MTFDLSVLIPARQEEWLPNTVADVLAHTSDRTEVIVVVDGEWPKTPLEQHPRVTVLREPTPIGQRAATNLAARVSTARYAMKLDAHCSVAQGIDTALIEAAQALGRECIQIPAQRNLHAYNQVCPTCEPRFCVDQAPHLPKCPRCQGPLTKELVWQPRKRTRTTAWRFDSDLHFQYRGFAQNADDEYPETMSCLGACWFLDREWFLNDLGGLDESHGSWGQMGVELAAKAWLSGGRMVCNTKTEYAHLFRVGGIGFPYPIKGSDQEAARTYSKNLWRSNSWAGQVKPLRWLVEKFWPVQGWTKEQVEALPESLVGAGVGLGVGGEVLGPIAVVAPCAPALDAIEPQPHQRGGDDEASKGSADERSHGGVNGLVEGGVPSAQGFKHGLRVAKTKGIVYYSDCRPDEAILRASRDSIAASGLPIVAVTLKPIDWPAATNIVLPLERGYLAMFKQILAGLEALDTDVAFLCEHDVLYSQSHFSFALCKNKRDRYHYNRHVYKVDAETGRALHYRCDQTSGLCADRQLLIDHYRKRVAHVEQHGFSRNNGFEPGTRKLRHGGFDDVDAAHWMSEFPNVDIRHSANLTPSRWRKDQFKNQKYTEGWTETDTIPGWGKAVDLVARLREGVAV